MARPLHIILIDYAATRSRFKVNRNLGTFLAPKTSTIDHPADYDPRKLRAGRGKVKRLFVNDTQLSQGNVHAMPTDCTDYHTRDRTVLAHKKLVLAIIKRAGCPYQFRDDAIQIAFATMLAAWETFDPSKGTFGVYVARAIKLTVAKALGRERSIASTTQSLDAPLPSQDDDDDADAPQTLHDLLTRCGPGEPQLVSRSNVGAIVQQIEDDMHAGMDRLTNMATWRGALATLEPVNRAILAHKAAGHTQADTAAALGLKQQTVSNRVAEAIGYLRKAVPKSLRMRDVLVEGALASNL